MKPCETLIMPMHLEHHSASVASGNGAMTFDVLMYSHRSLIAGSQGPTRILPGASVKTIRKNRGEFAVLLHHDQEKPAGLVKKVHESSIGLEGKVQLSNIALAREAYTLINDGVLTGVSIGFDVLSDYFRNVEGVGKVRFISEIELYELSLVVFPADPAARIQRPIDEDEEIARFAAKYEIDLEIAAMAEIVRHHEWESYIKARGYQQC